MNLENLRHELSNVAKGSRHGDHQKVADALEISRAYLWQLRNMKKKFNDTVEFRRMVMDATAEYRSLERARVRKLEEFEKQNS